MSRHTLNPFAPRIGMSELGAYILGRMVEVVHADEMSAEEKVAAIRALADLAADLSVFWASAYPSYGVRAEHIWHRLAGLSREGDPVYWEQRVREGGDGA